MRPAEAVAGALDAAPAALFVSSLGTATSALRLASDDGPHLYLGGAMGCALAVALGVADACGDRDVVAIVGDGDLVMGAGSLWSLCGLRPQNLVVLVLDDGRYSITGGQSLVAPNALAAILDGLPGVSQTTTATREAVAEATRLTPRPGIVLATIDEPAWPGPSPFVDPMHVISGFSRHVAGEGSAR